MLKEGLVAYMKHRKMKRAKGTSANVCEMTSSLTVDELIFGFASFWVFLDVYVSLLDRCISIA